MNDPPTSRGGGGGCAPPCPRAEGASEVAPPWSAMKEEGRPLDVTS
jgi:hypothetical protein